MNAKRLINRSAIARLVGMPAPTVSKRIARSGISPDAVLFVPSGGSQNEHPLFSIERLDELKTVIGTGEMNAGRAI